MEKRKFNVMAVLGEQLAGGGAGAGGSDRGQPAAG